MHDDERRLNNMPDDERRLAGKPDDERRLAGKPDDERRLTGGTEAEETLARELAELGPLMQRQEQVEAAGPDPAFARALRARLVGVETEAEAATPNPAFARDLRARLVGEGAPAAGEHLPGGQQPVPARRPLWQRAAPWASLAAALVAMLVALILLLRQVQPPAQTHGVLRVASKAAPARVSVPQPGLADLTRDFPVPPSLGGGGAGGGGALVSPVRTELDTPPNAPYPGHLRLTVAALPAGRLPASPATLTAYRLRAPLTAAHVARLLGIHARVTQMIGGNALWLVAADGGQRIDQPIHSLAVSTATGEVIYHDTAGETAPRRGARQMQPGDKGRGIAQTRAWLARIGWPGGGMPLQAITPIQEGAVSAWRIDLGWAGAGPTNGPGATVVIALSGRVVEARLWPPVAASFAVPVRRARRAVAALQGGNVPLAVSVPGLLTGQPGNGQGTIDRVRDIWVLTADSNGSLYLVPAYRFAGSARLHAIPVPGAPRRARTAPATMAATWYALVPAAVDHP